MKRQAKFGAAPSPRETQVAIAILFGRSNAQTCRDLGINLRTLETHRHRLYAKFGVHNTVDLIHTLMSGAAA